MKATNGKKVRRLATENAVAPQVPGLDQQFCELIEAVWACERAWSLEDKVDAAIKYGRDSR